MWSAHCDVQMPDDVPEYNDIHGNPEMSCELALIWPVFAWFGS